jgi:hypothetical protein
MKARQNSEDEFRRLAEGCIVAEPMPGMDKCLVMSASSPLGSGPLCQGVISVRHVVEDWMTMALTCGKNFGLTVGGRTRDWP